MIFPVPQKQIWFFGLIMITTFLITSCQVKAVTEMAAAPSEPFMIVTPPPAEAQPTAVNSLLANEANPTPIPSPTPVVTATLTTTPPKTIIVGSQTDTEQLILGQMLVQLLQANGYAVVDKTGLGGQTAVRTALEQGEIDLAIGFTGTTLTQAHQLPPDALPSEADKAIALVRTLDQPLGLTWLTPAAYRSQTILVVTAETSAAGIITLDDLARYVRENSNPLRLCTDSDFYARAQTGLRDLEASYSFTLSESSVYLLAAEDVLMGLHQGDCDVAVAQNSDGRLEAWELQPLVDNRAFFPSNAAAAVIRSPLLAAMPELERPLTRWGVRLDSQTMRQLIARVELGNDGQPASGDEETPAAAAAAFLIQAGLLGDAPQIVISSVLNPASQLLAALSERLLQENGYDLAPAASSGDPATLNTALQNGGVDLAWLYSNDALRYFYGVAPQQIPALGALAQEALVNDSNETALYWLEPSQLSQRDVVFVNRQTAVFQTALPNSINELAEQINRSDEPPTLCTLPSFFNDPDGLFYLFEQYGFSLPNSQIILASDSDDIYSQVAAGDCAIGVASGQNGSFATTPTLHILADPLEFFPNYTLTPVIRQEIAAAYPQLAGQLAQMTAVLTPAQFNQLLSHTQLGSDGQPNSGDEQPLATVAEQFLCQAGLLAECAQPDPIASGCRNLMVNGDFEQEGGWNIVETAVPATFTTSQTHQGSRAIQLGSDTTTSASFSSLSQQIQLPATARSATLSYWQYPASSDVDGGDTQSAAIYDETFAAIQQTLLWETANQQAWEHKTYDLSQFLGQTIFLYFGVVNDGDNAPTYMFIDDVALELCD